MKSFLALRGDCEFIFIGMQQVLLLVVAKGGSGGGVAVEAFFMQMTRIKMEQCVKFISSHFSPSHIRNVSPKSAFEHTSLRLASSADGRKKETFRLKINAIISHI